MKYKVHRIEVSRQNMHEQLDAFLLNFKGEVISIVPNVRPTFMGMGATAKIDYLLVVEKVA